MVYMIGEDTDYGKETTETHNGVPVYETDEPLVRRSRCSNCAFTAGTEANKCPLTTLKREACVNTGTFFYCHRDATDTYDLRKSEALCAGWLQAVTAKLERGELEAVPVEKRAELFATLDAIEQLEEKWPYRV